MENDPPILLSDSQPRICPHCESKVSSRARTCLTCGGELQLSPPASDEPVAPPPPAPSPRHILSQVAMTVVGLVMLAGLVWGFMVAVRGASTSQATPSVSFSTTSHAPTRSVTSSLALPTRDVTVTPSPLRQHTVEAGDTLLGIAQTYDTTVAELKALNNLDDEDILPIGQKLLVPPATGDHLDTPEPDTTHTIIHVVQSGETLLGIAQRYGLPLSSIQRLNDITNPELLREGQQLVIPVDSPPTATPGPPPTATPLSQYPPPPILSPLDGHLFQGSSTPVLLQWASTALLRSNEWYLVTIEQAGSDQTPVLFKTKTTAIYVPSELAPSAHEKQRTFVWHVKIVRQLDDKPTYEDGSLSGEIRSFLWQAQSVTPTPLPTSTSSPTRPPEQR